jgi:hypothetical protein
MPVALDVRPAAIASSFYAPDGRPPYGHAAKPPPPANSLAESWANLDEAGVHVPRSKQPGIEAQWIALGRIGGREPSAEAQKLFDSSPFFKEGQQGPGIARRLYERGRMAKTGQSKIYLWGEVHSCGKTLPAIAEALRLAPANGCTDFVSELGPVEGRLALMAGRKILERADKAGGLYRWAAEVNPDKLDTKMGMLMPALAERAGLKPIFAGSNSIGGKLDLEGVSASMSAATRKVLDSGGTPFVLCGGLHNQGIVRRLGEQPIGSANLPPHIIGHIFTPTTHRNSEDPQAQLSSWANLVSFINGSPPPNDPPRYEIHRLPPGTTRSLTDVANQTVDDVISGLAGGHLPSFMVRATEKHLRKKVEPVKAVEKFAADAGNIGVSQVRQKRPPTAANRNMRRVQN